MDDFVKHLIPVGFYRELRGGKPHEPSLREAVQAVASPDAARTIAYLNAGELLIATAGVVKDVLDERRGIIGAPDILTDGTYAWPAILAHYVEHHHVRVPEHFAGHMAAGGWVVPPGIEVRGLKLDRSVLSPPAGVP
jgi:hypothetical protein